MLGILAVMAEFESAGAEAERLQGAAEAAVVLTKGEAEAKALAMRADAYKQFNEAAIIQTALAALPEIVRAAAEPMKHIDTLTVMSTDGASEVVRNATRVVTESSAVVKGLTGIDIPTLIGGAMRTGGFTSKASGGHGSEPAKAPPAPPSAQTPRPPRNAAAECERRCRADRSGRAIRRRSWQRASARYLRSSDTRI